MVNIYTALDPGCSKIVVGVPSLMHHSYAASDAFECSSMQVNNKAILFQHSNQQLNKLLYVQFYSQKSDYIAMFSTSIIYFIPYTVCTTQFNATSSSWFVVFFLLSAFITCHTK